MHIFIYFLISLLNVQNIMNERDKLKKCVDKILNEFQISNEKDSNLLALIDESSVILKAFASEKLVDLPNLEENKNSRESFYDRNSSFENGVKHNSKVLMTISPLTIYKGVHILRKLKLFNNQQYFLINGHVIVILELSQKQRAVYNQKCYINPNVSQGEHLNENHLIKNLMTSLSSDQLIIFGKVDEIGYKTVENHLVVQTNGILKWKSNLENFIWKNQGWSDWSEWNFCSKSCNGIQQRYRQYIRKNENNLISEFNGYNIEQRECNIFKCKDAINLLLFYNNDVRNIHIKSKQFLANLKTEEVLKSIDQDNFTIMFSIRFKVDQKYFEKISNENLVSIQSKEKNEKYSSFTIKIIKNQIRIVQEKNFTSEMFAIRSSLYDMKWHQFSFSFRKDGLITCFIDCTWDRTIIMSKGSFELPNHQVNVEFNSKLISLIDWKQLTLISGNFARYQCSGKQTPIYDNKRTFKHVSDEE